MTTPREKLTITAMALVPFLLASAVFYALMGPRRKCSAAALAVASLLFGGMTFAAMFIPITTADGGATGGASTSSTLPAPPVKALGMASVGAVTDLPKTQAGCTYLCRDDTNCMQACRKLVCNRDCKNSPSTKRKFQYAPPGGNDPSVCYCQKKCGLLQDCGVDN